MRKGVLIGLVCLLLSTKVATLTGPLVAKYTIDNVITPMGQSGVFNAEACSYGWAFTWQ